MINVETPDMSTEQALAIHRVTATRMRNLLTSEGWELIAQAIKHDMNNAYMALQQATTGDMALKASSAYTIMKNLLALPEEAATQSLQRIRALEETLLSEAKSNPVHHRSHQLPSKKPKI